MLFTNCLLFFLQARSVLEKAKVTLDAENKELSVDLDAERVARADLEKRRRGLEASNSEQTQRNEDCNRRIEELEASKRKLQVSELTGMHLLYIREV